MDFLIYYPLLVFVFSALLWSVAFFLKGYMFYVFGAVRLAFDVLVLFIAYDVGQGQRILIYTALALLTSSLFAISWAIIGCYRNRKE